MPTGRRGLSYPALPINTASTSISSIPRKHHGSSSVNAEGSSSLPIQSQILVQGNSGSHHHGQALHNLTRQHTSPKPTTTSSLQPAYPPRSNVPVSQSHTTELQAATAREIDAIDTFLASINHPAQPTSGTAKDSNQSQTKRKLTSNAESARSVKRSRQNTPDRHEAQSQQISQSQSNDHKATPKIPAGELYVSTSSGSRLVNSHQASDSETSTTERPLFQGGPRTQMDYARINPISTASSMPTAKLPGSEVVHAQHQAMRHIGNTSTTARTPVQACPSAQTSHSRTSPADVTSSLPTAKSPGSQQVNAHHITSHDHETSTTETSAIQAIPSLHTSHSRTNSKSATSSSPTAKLPIATANQTQLSATTSHHPTQSALSTIELQSTMPPSLCRPTLSTAKQPLRNKDSRTLSRVVGLRVRRDASSVTQPNRAEVGFFDLPYELREMVYNNIHSGYSSHWRTENCWRARDGSDFPVKLLRVNRHFADECSALFLRKRILLAVQPGTVSHPPVRLSQYHPPLSRLKNVRLSIDISHGWDSVVSKSQKSKPEAVASALCHIITKMTALEELQIQIWVWSRQLAPGFRRVFESAEFGSLCHSYALLDCTKSIVVEDIS